MSSLLKRSILDDHFLLAKSTSYKLQLIHTLLHNLVREILIYALQGSNHNQNITNLKEEFLCIHFSVRNDYKLIYASVLLSMIIITRQTSK